MELPTGPQISYSYDELDRLVEANKLHGTSGITLTSTIMQYDIAGRKVEMDDPDMGVWTYDYDALGNLEEQKDARDCTITLTYDLLNRLTDKAYSGAGACAVMVDVAYIYDQGGASANALGRRTSMTDASGSTEWEYDERGRVTSETKTVTGIGTYATGWQYNNADWVTGMTYPGDDVGGSGEIIIFDPTPQGVVRGVTGDYSYASGIQYDAAGRMTQLVRGSVTTSYDFNDWDEQKYIDNEWIGQGGRLEGMLSTGLQDLSYTYDHNGNIASIVDDVAIESLTFSYDDLNQLTGVTGA